MMGEELLREPVQIVRAGDLELRSKHLAAVLGCQLRRNLVLQIPRNNRGLVAPHVARNMEVIAQVRDVVMIDRHVHKRERMRTGRALQVLPLNQRNLSSRRRHQHRRVAEVVHLIRWNRRLRCRRNRGEREHQSNGKQKPRHTR